MKFTEKYEILELLTSGRVSTFLVRERGGQIQALVHTFECPATIGARPQTSSIIEHFTSLAPIPAEPVTEAGFDEVSSAAFIVTRVPAASLLQSWVRAYRSFSTGRGSEGRNPEGPGKAARVLDENATAEISASDVQKILRQNERAKNHRPPESSPPISTEAFSISSPSAPSTHKGEFTRLFEQPEAFQPLGRSGATSSEEATVPEPLNPTGHDFPATNYGAVTPLTNTRPPKDDLSEGGSPGLGAPEPGSFTQLFSGTDEGSNRLGKTPEPTPAKEPGAFTKEFMAITGKTQPNADSGSGASGKPLANSSDPAFGSLPPPSSSMSKRPAEKFEGNSDVMKSSTGEFTSFFRGPFEQPAASEKSFEYPDPAQAAAPSSKAGDFTQMFGPETRLGKEAAPAAPPSTQEPAQPPSFTQIFSENNKVGARLGVSSRLDSDPLPPDSAKPPIASTASSSGIPAMFSGTVLPNASRGGAFTPPEVKSIPSGDNTFVNRAGRNDATNVFQPRGGEEPSTVEEAPSGPSEFTMFLDRSQLRAVLPLESAMNAASPGAPRPAFSAPPMPQAPKPSFAMPAPPIPAAQMPPMALPQAPPAPRPPAKGSASSYWPLITVLTALLAIGALLIMYFALKH